MESSLPSPFSLNLTETYIGVHWEEEGKIVLSFVELENPCP